MTTGPIGRSAGSIIDALGWLLLAGALSKYLQPIEASVVLFGLVIAELSSRLLVVELPRPQFEDSTSNNWDELLGIALMRWVVLLIVTLVLACYSQVWFFEGHDYALICVLGLVLSQMLLRLSFARLAVNQKQCAALVGLRNAMLAIGVFCIAEIGLINGDLVLSLSLALSLSALILVFFFLPQRRADEKSGWLNSRSSGKLPIATIPIGWAYADLIIITCALTPQNTFGYLIARGLAQIVPLSLNLVGDRIAHALYSTYDDEKPESFVAIAARTNLGFLLIGGSASLVGLSAGIYVPVLFGLDATNFRDILFWLLVAQASPVFFGATAMLLQTTRRNVVTTFLSLLGVLTLVSTYILLDIKEPKQLAQMFAYSHLIIAAISAGYLGLKFGVWPGLTAILFRQIRLL